MAFFHLVQPTEAGVLTFVRIACTIGCESRVAAHNGTTTGDTQPVDSTETLKGTYFITFACCPQLHIYICSSLDNTPQGNRTLVHSSQSKSSRDTEWIRIPKHTQCQGGAQGLPG